MFNFLRFEKKKKNPSMVAKKTQIKRILGEYTEKSTIAGLHYAFDSSQGPML